MFAETKKKIDDKMCITGIVHSKLTFQPFTPHCLLDVGSGHAF